MTVLGIGNTILSDEGLGVVAVETLRQRFDFDPPVELIDGGTIGIDLLYFIEDAELLLVLDAISGGGPPGTFYKFKGEEVRKYFRNKVSMHEIGFQEVLGLLELKGNKLKEIVVMGLEPKVIDMGTELSPEVMNNMEKLLDEALSQLREWGVEVLEKTLRR
ncbi:MAG: HyaD/HybD family hydrogenase maturation endopeptidase [Aquificae bacterium]|nr:HyaD/HybD family hydrogenase maturation endopeptidase [Aquificota bacterium]